MALLTVRTAAQRLGVGYSTLKQWIYSGTVRTTLWTTERNVAMQTLRKGAGVLK